MSWTMYRKPDDTYAIFSSVVDDFIVDGVTLDEAERYFMEREKELSEERWERFVSVAHGDRPRSPMAPIDYEDAVRWMDDE